MFVSIVMYFNILILQLIVYTEFQGHSLKSLSEGTFLYDFIPDLHFDSMNREWFSDVGTGIILTMVIKIGNPAIAIFCISLLQRYAILMVL
jgi:hypothetical protein